MRLSIKEIAQYVNANVIGGNENHDANAHAQENAHAHASTHTQAQASATTQSSVVAQPLPR